MKINSLKNQTFGAIYFENGGKETKIDNKTYKKVIKKAKLSKIQKQTIKDIMQNKNLTPKLVKDLEKIKTDIYISPKPYTNNVEIKLYSDIDWFGKKTIPYDGRYTTKMQTNINPEFQGDFISHIKISNFFRRANDMDFGSDKNLTVINDVLQGK